MMLHALLLTGTLALAAPDGAPTEAMACFHAEQKQLDKKHQQDIDKDIEDGANYSKMVEKEYKLSTNHDYIARVNRIGGELAAVARVTPVRVRWGDKRLNPFEYKFTVIEGEDVNAFSLPGGFIYVYEGLVKFVESDDELAGVLAHEIAHAAFRHVATLQREQSRFQMATLPLILAALLGGKGGGELLTGVQLAGIAKTSGWTEQAEEASDYGGYQYLRKTSFDPVGMLTFMERLAREDMARQAIDWGIFLTHPPSSKRAAALIKYMKDDGHAIRRSKVTQTFRTTLKPVEGSKVEAWFAGRKLHTFAGPEAQSRAEAAAEKLNAFFDQQPELYEVQIRKDGSIVGKNKILFKIADDDTASGEGSVDELRVNAEHAIKRSLTFLSYPIWMSR